MNNSGSQAVKDTGGTALKVEIISDAYSQMRISGLTVQPTPEDLELALMRLENMVAEWETRNISTGYNFEENPDPNSFINVIRGYWQCLATNLAARLIPDFNKPVPPELHAQARQSLSNLSGRSAFNRVSGVPYPSRMARGSGNTLRYNRWNRFYRNQAQAPNSASTNQMIIGDIDDFIEHFDAYLDAGETISSFSIQTDPSLKLVSSSNTDDDVLYRIEAISNTDGTSPDIQQLTIIATTSTGRVETRFVFFSITSSDV